MSFSETGKAKLSFNFRCGMTGCKASKKWTLDDIVSGAEYTNSSTIG